MQKVCHTESMTETLCANDCCSYFVIVLEQLAISWTRRVSVSSCHEMDDENCHVSLIHIPTGKGENLNLGKTLKATPPNLILVQNLGKLLSGALWLLLFHARLPKFFL